MFSAAPKRGMSKRCKPQQLKLSLGSSSGASGSCLPTGPNSRGKSSGKDDAPMVSRASTTCTMAGAPTRGTLRARARAPEFLSKWPPLRERSSCCASSVQASPRTLAALLLREEGFYHQNERAITCVDCHLDSERALEFLSKWPPLRERSSCCAPSLQASPLTLAALLVREEGFYHQNKRAVTCVDYLLDSDPMEASLSKLVTQLEMKQVPLLAGSSVPTYASPPLGVLPMQEARVEDCSCYLGDANGNVIGWPPHKYSSL